MHRKEVQRKQNRDSRVNYSRRKTTGNKHVHCVFPKTVLLLSPLPVGVLRTVMLSFVFLRCRLVLELAQKQECNEVMNSQHAVTKYKNFLHVNFTYLINAFYRLYKRRSILACTQYHHWDRKVSCVFIVSPAWRLYVTLACRGCLMHLRSRAMIFMADRCRRAILFLLPDSG